MAENSSGDAPEAPETPEGVKYFHWFHHHLTTNWEALMKPPVLIVLLLICFFAYHFGANRSEETIGIKNERIAFLTEQLGAYKDRLNGASPDEAAKQLRELQKLVEKQQGKLNKIFPDHQRIMSNQQKKNIGDNASKFQAAIKSPLFLYADNIGDAPFYAQEFLRIFNENKIPIAGVIPSNCASEESGILIGLIDPSKPSDKAVSFFNLLKLSGFDPHYTKWNAPDFMNKQQDFDLFVCN